MRSKTLLIGVVGIVIGVLLSTAVVFAGSLNPPAGPPGSSSQMYTLQQIYDRLTSGAAGSKMTEFTEPATGPSAGTMRTLDEIMAQAPVADNANGATAADVKGGKTFWGLRTDGTWGTRTGTLALNPAPPCFDLTHRYVDCGNGTVTDTVTGLIWLKNANCFGLQNYVAANNAAAGLQTGACGLTDNSTPGDWRLPTGEEFLAILLSSCPVAPKIVGNGSPGTGCYSDSPWATGVQSGYYWTSETGAGLTSVAWLVGLAGGNVGTGSKATTPAYVWPVRGGQ